MFARLHGNVRFGSLADLSPDINPMSASGGIAALQVENFQKPNLNRLSYSVLLLEIVSVGNILRGGTVMYDVANEKVSIDIVEYKRAN